MEGKPVAAAVAERFVLPGRNDAQGLWDVVQGRVEIHGHLAGIARCPNLGNKTDSEQSKAFYMAWHVYTALCSSTNRMPHTQGVDTFRRFFPGQTMPDPKLEWGSFQSTICP